MNQIRFVFADSKGQNGCPVFLSWARSTENATTSLIECKDFSAQGQRSNYFKTSYQRFQSMFKLFLR